MSQRSKLVFLDINFVSIFIQFICPRLCSLVYCLMQREPSNRCIGKSVLLPVTVAFSIFDLSQRALSERGRELSAATVLIFIQQKTSEEDAHI